MLFIYSAFLTLTLSLKDLKMAGQLALGPGKDERLGSPHYIFHPNVITFFKQVYK